LLDESRWIDAGCGTLDRIDERLFDSDAPRAVWRDGRSAQAALLEDHAAYLMAIIERLSVRWEVGWLNRSEALAERIVEQFLEAQADALYMTPRGYEQLPMRPTANLDEATPSGAALTALAFTRLGHLTDSPDWISMAERILQAALLRQPDLRVYRPTRETGGLPDQLQAVAASREPTAVVCTGDRCLQPADSARSLVDRLAEAGVSVEVVE
jgi:uncharacterized protein YyaL (SSP411 family)